MIMAYLPCPRTHYRFGQPSLANAHLGDGVIFNKPSYSYRPPLYTSPYPLMLTSPPNNLGQPEPHGS